MDIKLITSDMDKIKADAVIIGIFEDTDGNDIEKMLDKTLDGSVARLRQTKEIWGKLSELTIMYSPARFKASKAVILGLGKKQEFTAVKLRAAVADACRILQRKNSLDLALVLPDTGLDAGDIGLAAAEGAHLGTYSFRKHLTKEADYGGLKALTVALSSKFDKDVFEQGVKKGVIIARAVMLARDMANEPSNHMTPQAMADTAQKVAKDSGLKIEVLERRDMEKLGMGGILGVSRGSATTHPPKLIILRHNGRSDDGWDLALVGKGLTFDSGGISIKPSEKMEEMKFDMSGGAATIAAMAAIGQLKLGLNVIAAIPATENMPDGGAFKPGDVLKMFTGKTVEVISTDAEGRLILADALGYIDREKPKAIVDMATLTGACVIALGDKASAAITNNQPLLDKVIKAGEAAGERIWQLPAWDEYREQYKSDYADIKNVGGRQAGTITAGLFLSEFISADTPWVHLDIAGTASGDKEKGHLTKGGSGVPVATLVNLAERLAQE